MAGMTLRRPTGGAMAGVNGTGAVYNSATGSFVDNPVDPASNARTAALTAPKYTTSPLGVVSQYNHTNQIWDTVGRVPGTAMTSGGTRSGAGGGADDAARRAAMLALAQEVRRGPKGYEAPQVPIVTSGADGGSPYDLAGENAAYGAAKERTGMAMQAALRGLRSQMQGRGIGGSGIEGDKLGDLYSSGLGELGATDRQLAEVRAGRAFSAGQADTDRTIGAHGTNAGLTEAARQYEADSWRQRMEMIMRLTQAAY